MEKLSWTTIYNRLHHTSPRLSTLTADKKEQKDHHVHHDTEVNPFRLINRSRLTDTFTKLASIGSPAAHTPKEFPSSEGQKKIALELKKELEQIDGLVDVTLDPKYYVVTATFPSNISKPNSERPTIGLVSHYDTYYGLPSDTVNPIIHYKYTSGNIVLPKDGTIIREKDLNKFKGEDIITSDGSTLLGADDKAGISEIIELLRVYSENPHLKHPTIKIAFTPDEENGGFIKNFDIKGFGADFAYTVDGGYFNEVSANTIGIEKFEVIFSGVSTHTGSAKNRMLNATRMATDFIKKMPLSESPEKTDGWKGFYHIDSINGDIEKVIIKGQLRDFDHKKNLKRIKNLHKWAKQIEKRYKGSKSEVKVDHIVSNLNEGVKKQPAILKYAEEGVTRTLRQSGLKHKIDKAPTRGGTDGAQLTERGLTAPNLAAGGMNFHSKNEFVSSQEMVRDTANLFNIMSVWAEKIERNPS